MMNIEHYFYATSLNEACECLASVKGSAVLGGCGYLRMGSKQITTAIDLSKLKLDYVNETETQIEIGAMATLRQMETSPVLKKYFNGILGRSVRDIVGIQMRNLVTVGGTVAGRYPFSDFLLALLALDTTVKFVNQNEISLKDYLEGKSIKGILEKIIIKKENRVAFFQSVRNSQTDYAIINVAVSKKDNKFIVVVGARPQKAMRVPEAEAYLNEKGLDEDTAVTAGLIATEVLTFGDNLRGSAAYRKAVCPALIKRALLEVYYAG